MKNYNVIKIKSPRIINETHIKLKNNQANPFSKLINDTNTQTYDA